MAKWRKLLACLPSSCVSVAAIAQWSPPEQMQYTIEIKDSGNNNGIVEPGEWMNFYVSAEYTPKIDEPTKYQYPNGSWHDAKIKAVSRALIAVWNVKNGETGTLGVTGWNPHFVKSGKPWSGGGGSLWDLEILGGPQKPMGGNPPNPDTSNPILLFGLAWSPKGNYTPREVVYQLDGIAGNLFVEVLELGPDVWYANFAKVLPDPGPITFQVIPASSSLGALTFAALCCARRKRR